MEIATAGIAAATCWAALYFGLKAVMPRTVRGWIRLCCREARAWQLGAPSRQNARMSVLFSVCVCPSQVGRKLHNSDGTALNPVTATRDEAVNTGEGAVRAVTIIYASSICVLSALSNLVTGPWAYSSVGEKNTPLQTLTLQMSLGYFIFDLAWSVTAGGETLLMCCHHLASLGAVLSGLFLDASGRL
jgi:hypothetical protein